MKPALLHTAHAELVFGFCADVGLYSTDADSPQRRGPLVLEEALKGRPLGSVLLWLEALYQNQGPASLEGTSSC